MVARYSKIREIAERYRVSVDAVYLWIRQGKIPAECVVRIAGTVRIDEHEFERQLQAGALYRPRRHKSSEAVAGEDSFTTRKSGSLIEHRWTTEGTAVEPVHPFSPEMRESER